MKIDDIEKRVSPHNLKKLRLFVNRFYDKNFQCYLVGGSVRDLLLGREVYDFDFTTDARPEEVQKLFPKVIPTGIKHGTVTVFFQGHPFEVTTFRSDGEYFDGRRPESVRYATDLKEDVKRRDFTINGLAYDLRKNVIIDLVGGLEDLENKLVKTIGNPLERFGEDGLRTIRACRFAAKLNFKIEEETFKAIRETLPVTKKVSVERMRDELMKIMEVETPSIGIDCLRESGLLQIMLPELDATYDVAQNKYHVYDVYHHSVYACDAADSNSPLVRFASLLHDVGKVPVRRMSDQGDYTFYNHEVVGAKMVRRIMKRYKFSNEEIEKVHNLVIHHMFHYTDDWTDGAVRRFIRKVGIENIEELVRLRLADRVGNGSREGIPVPINRLMQRIEKIIEDENAITVKDLNVNGNIIMQRYNIPSGPVIGKILNELLEIVLDDPDFNTEEQLLEKADEIYNGLVENSQ